MPLRISSEADALRWARRCALITALGGASLLASPAAYAVDNDLDGVPEYGFLTPSAVSVSLDQVDRIYVVDMDDDNDLNLLVANETTISWVENSDGAGTMGPLQLFARGWPTRIPVTKTEIGKRGQTRPEPVHIGPRHDAWFYKKMKRLGIG